MSCFRTWKKTSQKLKVESWVMAGTLIYSWWIFSVERSKPKEFAWPSNIPHWIMVLNAILSFILDRAIPRYWKNMNLCYTCIYILVRFPTICVWANRKKLTSIVNESADQHSKCSKVRLASKYFQTTWLQCWVYISCGSNKYSQLKIGKLAEFTLAPHSPLWLSTASDEGVFASNRVKNGPKRAKKGLKRAKSNNLQKSDPIRKL